MFREKSCEHLQNFAPVRPASYECDECIKTGSQWVHLRTCQTCGMTLCCDSSPNQHASKHALSHEHPVVMSAEPGEHWAYCYIHKLINVQKNNPQ